MGANAAGLEDAFLIREARDEDRAFIENAWRATMLATCPAASGAGPQHFHREMSRVFSRLLPKALARVACDPKDPGTLVGFAVMTGPELHYVYTAGDFRELGIVPLLLAGCDIRRYTFRTPQGDRRLKPRERNWVYTPRFTI